MTFQDISFGASVAENDNDLHNYFFEFKGFNKLISGEKKFIIGRKGSGKTALIKELHNRIKTEILKDYKLNDFPIRQISKFDEGQIDKFRFVPIIKFLILTELSNEILKNEIRQISNEKNIFFLEHLIKDFSSDYTLVEKINTLEKNDKNIKIGGKVLDFGLDFGYNTKSNEKTKSGFIYYSKLNNILIETINKINPNNSYYFFFDRLDDGYKEKYNYELRALIQSALDLSNEIDNKKFKPLIALRDDVLKSFYKIDSEINKIDELCIFLEWKSYDLKELINKRIKHSTNGVWEDFVSEKYKYKGKENSVWHYLFVRTMERPRDIIRFLQFCQEENKDKLLNRKEVSEAEKKYSKWLKQEIENELSSFFGKEELKIIFGILLEINTSIFERKLFEDYINNRLSYYLKTNRLNASGLIEILFQYGILGITDKNGRYLFFFKNNVDYYNSDSLVVHNGLSKSLFLNTNKNIVKKGIKCEDIKLIELGKHILIQKVNSIAIRREFKNNKKSYSTTLNIKLKEKILEIYIFNIKIFLLDNNGEIINGIEFNLERYSNSYKRLERLLKGEISTGNTHINLDLRRDKNNLLNENIDRITFFKISGEMFKINK